MSKKKDDATRLEELLRRRQELDRRLAEYKRTFAVLFADVSGSTRFFDERGDVSGVAMIQAFVDRASPAVIEAGGRIVKTLGDAILAYFEGAREAVGAAVALQRDFAAANQNRAPGDRIVLRIGINYGSGFVKDDDVFGDVVNVAARLQGVAVPGQVVVSAAVAEAARAAGYSVVEVGSVELRGKSAPQAVLVVVWEEAAEARRPLALVLLDAAGNTVSQYALGEEWTLLGRREGQMRFPGDRLLGARHARFRREQGGVRVEPLGSSAVFVRLRAAARLAAGDTFLVGRQLVEFKVQPSVPNPGTAEAWGAALVAGGKKYPLHEPVVVIGRTAGDVRFPQDGQVSRQHARIRLSEAGFELEDLGSTNGTFIRVRERALLACGDTVLCGSQLLRVV